MDTLLAFSKKFLLQPLEGWNVMDDKMVVSETTNVLGDAFERLEERIPIELELTSDIDKVWMRAVTTPRTDSCFFLSLFQNAMKK